MFSTYSKSFAGSMLVSACLLFGGTAMAADATPDQVYQAAQAGNFREAQQMMDQILRDHPNSAKAHFVQAELLGKQGKLQQAQEELNTALRLDPNQNFARPGAVDELRTLIASGNSSRAQGTLSGIPWGLILGIAAVLIVISMVMRARRRAAYPQGGSGPYGPSGGYGPARGPMPYGGPQGGPGVPQGYGYPGGVGPGQATGGMGSGILGGLATGAAVGAGVVAGEALLNRVINGGSANAAGNPANAGNVVNSDAQGASAANSPEPGYDMGGNDFGLRDASSWDDADPTRKLSNNDGGADSMNVGNPWGDSGSGDGGGSWDDGSSSSDGGGSWDDGGGGGSDDWT